MRIPVPLTNSLTAQVEVLLRKSAEKAAGASATDASPQNGNASHRNVQSGSGSTPGVAVFSSFGNDANGSLNWNLGAGRNDALPLEQSGVPFEMPDMEYQPRVEAAGATSYELLGLGLFEALPPTEMIEEL